MNTIKENDVVALTQDTVATNKQTRKPILLKRGQVGAVLMKHDDEHFLIDFSDVDGESYAMETVSIDCLMTLHYTPVLENAQ
jgi:hypothetical protein